MQIWPLRIRETFDECVKTGTIGNVPPREKEIEYYQQLEELAMVA